MASHAHAHEKLGESKKGKTLEEGRERTEREREKERENDLAALTHPSNEERVFQVDVQGAA